MGKGENAPSLGIAVPAGLAGKADGQPGAEGRETVPCRMFCGLRNLTLSRSPPGTCRRRCLRLDVS